MTARKALYLATITDGVVEIEGPAPLDDIREVLRAEGLEVVPLAGRVGAIEFGSPMHTEIPYVSSLEVTRGANHPLQRTMGTVEIERGEWKESNGSNGHGEHHDTERPAGIPDLEVANEKGVPVVQGFADSRKLPSERIAELVAEGPRTNKMGTVGWALDVIGRVMDEQERCAR